MIPIVAANVLEIVVDFTNPDSLALVSFLVTTGDVAAIVATVWYLVFKAKKIQEIVPAY